MAAIIGSLRAELSATIAKFQEDMGKAANIVKSTAREMTKVGTEFKKAGAQMQSVGTALTKTITLPLVGIGLAVAKVGIDFESSFAGVRKTVQATEPEFAKMAQGFRDLAKTIPVSVNELNRLGEAAGALGIPKEEVVDFARVMALLGVTTNVTSDQAAESIAKIQNIFGAAGQDTERFASTLVALGNDGASTEEQILSMATRIAGAGNVIGLTQGEVLGFASALSSVGLEAEAGGSAISRVFIEIASAVSKGGTAVEGFAKVAGKPIKEFARLFKEDASTAVEQFISGLGRIKDSGGDLLGTLEELGFSEIRTRDALLRAAGAGDLLRDSLALQSKAWKDNTALTKEANERFKTTASQLTLLGNRLKDIGITLFTALKPAIDSALGAMNALLPVIASMANAFAGLPGSVQLGVIGVAGFAAALGPLVFIAGQVVSSMGALILAFGKGGIATRLLLGIFTPGPAVLGLFASALTLLTGPIGWVVGISAAILTATSTWDEFFRILKAGAEIIGNLVVGAFNRFVDVGRPVVRLIGDLVAFIGQIFGVTSSIKAMASGFATAMGWIADKAERASAALRGIPLAEFQASLAAQRNGLQQTGEAVNQTADAFKNLKDRLSGALASKDLGELTKVVRELSTEGALTWPVMRKIATEAAALQQQGASLTPELQNIVNALTTIDTQQPGVSGFASLTSTLAAARAELAKLSSADMKALSAAVQSGAFSMEELKKTTGLSEAALKLFQDRVKGVDDAFGKANAELVKAQREVGKLTVAQKAQIVSLHNFGIETGKIAAVMKVSETAIKDFLDAGKALRDSDNWVGEQQIKAAEEAQEAFKKLREQLSEIERHGASISGVFKMFAGDLEKLGEHIEPEKIREWAHEWAFTGPLLDDLDLKSEVFGDTLDSLAQSMTQLAQVSGDAFGGVAQDLAGILVSWNAARKAADAYKNATTAAGKAAALFAGVAAVASATDPKTHSTAGTVVGGAVTGAEIGSSIIPGGGVPGAIIGAFVGWWRSSRSEFKKLGQQIGNELGVAIPKELLIAWEGESKEFGRQATMFLHLDEIIAVAGGVAKFGIDKATASARDLFVMIETGQLTVEQAGKTFNNVFSELAEHVKPGGLVSAGFLELLALNQRFGTEAASVAKFIGDQIQTNIVGGLTRATSVSKAAREQLAADQKTLADLMQQYDRGSSADKARLKQQIDEVSNSIAVQEGILKATTVTSQNAANAMAAGLAVAFSEMQKAGVPILEIVKQLQPLISELSAQFDVAGYTGGAAFEGIRALVAVASDEIAGPALEAVTGFGQALAGLHNIGMLDQQTFAGLSEQITNTFTSLVAQGKDGNQVLRLMQPSLQTLWELQQRYHFAVDETTQAMLDEAEAQGYIGEKHKPIQEQMLDATNRIADAVEGLGRVFGTLPAAAKEAADGITKNLGNIRLPRIRIPVDFVPGRGVEGPDGAVVRPQSFAGGSRGIRDFGLGTPAMLHGREAVLTEAEIANLLEYGPAMDQAPANSEGLTINVTNNFNGSVLAEEEYVETHIVAPVLTGIERNYRPQFERLVRGTR